MGIVITQEIFEKRFKDKYGTDFVPISKYNGYSTDIEIQHKTCGYVFKRKASALNSKNSCKKLHCPKCNPLLPGIELIPYINDLSVTVPEICEFLVDKEDAHRYRKNSEKKIWFRCPVCNKERLLTIANVAKNMHVNCPSCSDGFSYPNKFMANILDQLDVKYTTEYQPDWLKPFRYDFYLPDYNLIIEMDGELGHGHKQMDDYDTLERDKEKDQKANEHGLTVIRIDCCYKSNRFGKIKNSILNSSLITYLNLSNIDWQKCNQQACESKVWKVKELILKNVPQEIITEELKISHTCLNNYCRYLVEMDALDKEALREYRLHWRKHPTNINRKTPYGQSRAKKVICCETGEIFESAKKAAEKYGNSGIWQAIATGGKCANYHWKYIKDYPKNHDFSKIEKRWKPVIHEDSPYYIKQMSLDGKIINIFHNFKEIEETLGYKRNSIFNACTGKYRQSHNFKWSYIDTSDVDESFFIKKGA